MTTEHIPELPLLSDSARHTIQQLLSGEFLGASRNIRQINDLFVDIAAGWEGDSGQALVDTLLATGDYLSATRGRNTPAIANAIRLVLKGLQQESGTTPEQIQILIEARRTEYNALSIRNAELIAEYGANLLAACEVVLAFDYSSSMSAILKKLGERGRKIRLIVPESRSLDGGRPIVNEATTYGHTVVFIVDMAFSHFLPQSEAVLIGAETIFANGDCWNTVGSYPIAVLAQQHHIPFYVPTEFIKIDARSFTGQQKSIQPHNYAAILNYPTSLKQPDLVSVIAPDLDRVPASLITAYITPHGVMPPGQIWSETRQFLESGGVTIF